MGAQLVTGIGYGIAKCPWCQATIPLNMGGFLILHVRWDDQRCPGSHMPGVPS